MHLLYLSTTQTVCLIIVTVAITLFFILATVLAVVGINVLNKAKLVIAKAETAIDSVEEASLTIKNMGAQAGGPLGILKIVKSIIDTVNRKK